MAELRFDKVAVFGATGATGIHLSRQFLARGTAVRAISRSRANLDRCFAGEAVDTVVADAADSEAARRAVEGCDLVFDCIGLPGERMALHPVTARGIAEAVGACGARCVHISSFWAYLPLARSPLDESHPREGGGAWVRYRREAENILEGAGAAVLHLPDFFGPQVETGTLQQALVDAAAGKTVNWIGGVDVEREYLFVADAARLAADIAHRAGAYGQRWVLPGAGGLSGREVARIAGRHLGRPLKLRGAGPVTLRLASLFVKPLRGFLQMAPDYSRPIAYDAAKLHGLIGGWSLTPYDAAFAETLDWLAATKG